MQLTQELTAQLQALLAMPTTSTTMTVGISRGLFESAVSNSTLSSIKFDFQCCSNLRLAVADTTLDVASTEKVLEKFQAAAKSAEGVLHVRSSLTMEVAEQVMDAFEECDGATYLNLTFSISSDIITGKKVTDNEGIVKPSIKFAGIQKLLTFSAGTNPMAERGVLATEEELIQLIKEDASRSRLGFNGWASAQANNGKKEQGDTAQATLDALMA